MTVRTDPRTKTNLLRRGLADALLAVPIGTRLPTIRSLADRFDASIGATQTVLSGLERAGAITTERSGRSGTVMTGRSVGALWEAARQEPLVLALPLPSTRTVHALATALKSSFAEAGVDAYLQFIRGSRNRLAALRGQRCHAIVISALAAGGLDGPSESVALTLAPGSFVLEHRVFQRKGTDVRSVRRIGFDPDSYDFERLSDLEFGTSVERHQGMYMGLAEALTNGAIDAVILDAEESFVRLGPEVISQPLSATTLHRLDGQNTAAAVVIRSDDVGTASVVQACLDRAVVRRIQSDVRAGRLAPTY